MFRLLPIRVLIGLYLFCLFETSISRSFAIVGGAPPAGSFGSSVVMIFGSNRVFCNAVAIGRDLLLSSTQCVLPGATYKYASNGRSGRPILKDIARIERNPDFDLQKLLNYRATPDLALIKTSQALPAYIPPVPLSSATLAVGDTLYVVGYGVSVPGDTSSAGTARVAKLVVSKDPGRLQIRLFDPKHEGRDAGLGACSSDAGAPAFRLEGDTVAVVGIVSWSTGPGMSPGCGGLTGIVPVQPFRSWMVDTARALGAPLD